MNKVTVSLNRLAAVYRQKPQVMGIINVTSDSFYAASRVAFVDDALKKAQQMLQQGATWIDIGAESTRPGSLMVSEQEEMDRLLPIVLKLAAELPIQISVDTQKPAVMQAAIAAGVAMINDINALQADGALEVVLQSNVLVCLMHKKGEPKDMQVAPYYQDIVAEVYQFLSQRQEACLQKGIDFSRIIIDPGFGFGKTDAHNLTLLRHLDTFLELGTPILVGLSRKATIGRILNVPPEERLSGSLAQTVLAMLQGAQIIRTHDVLPTVQAITVAHCVLQECELT